MQDPFKPSFGVSPPLLVGRDDLITDFDEALQGGPGASGRATIYTGARGSGKTVMLNAVEDLSMNHGWLYVSETATPGFVNRLTNEHFPRLLRAIDPNAVRSRLTGITLPFAAGGLNWETLEPHVVTLGLRGQIALLADLQAEHGSGLLITLDEIHRNQINELRELATAIQHSFREEKQLAFVGAGLASAVGELLNEETLTFLRRAERYELKSVRTHDVDRALREPIYTAGRTITDEALETMVDGTKGYPFLIQLVGSQVWRQHPNKVEITIEDARNGVAAALRKVGSLVHAPALSGTSEVDRSFLLAMARDEGPSRVADIQERLGVTANYVSQYRLRLIEAELIMPVGWGKVQFALPYLGEYLREYVASEI